MLNTKPEAVSCDCSRSIIKPDNTNYTRISYRVGEAAQATGLSEDSLRRMISSGQIKAKQVSPNGDYQRTITIIPAVELYRVFGECV